MTPDAKRKRKQRELEAAAPLSGKQLRLRRHDTSMARVPQAALAAEKSKKNKPFWQR